MLHKKYEMRRKVSNARRIEFWVLHVHVVVFYPISAFIRPFSLSLFSIFTSIVKQNIVKFTISKSFISWRNRRIRMMVRFSVDSRAAGDRVAGLLVLLYSQILSKRCKHKGKAIFRFLWFLSNFYLQLTETSSVHGKHDENYKAIKFVRKLVSNKETFKNFIHNLFTVRLFQYFSLLFCPQTITSFSEIKRITNHKEKKCVQSETWTIQWMK